ncbi:hypothetical protein Q8791_10320 [Nocardiopsis sp. CT-R113]|uniref:Tetracyclin repressor-like C-terminal domain-containing protein n=1 Tax=Nocardiopsis codii TaxID=3065942 RepID=A0ABU7K604_9ACTN|nr:hypothetical protein [Nocardiopsis sp. CT-R113]
MPRATARGSPRSPRLNRDDPGRSRTRKDRERPLLAKRRILCDLLSAQAGVLEHNVSPQVAARHMHAAVDNVAGLAALAEQHLPELGESAPQSTAAMIMAVGAVWTHARPSPAMLAAYEADPSLTAFQLDFTTALQEKPATLIAGTIARASA